MYSSKGIAFPNANAISASLTAGVTADRVPDFGDVWPTFYVAQDDVRHTQAGLARINDDSVVGYHYEDSDPNDVHAFEGLAQHILIWNSTAVTAAEVRAYVALTLPNLRNGGDTT